MRGLFVTGTDTGVGKTFIASGLVRALHEEGWRVGVMKPLETGCAVGQNGLEPADARVLWEAAGRTQDLASVCPYRFTAPLAPDVAARQASRHIDPVAIVEGFQAIAKAHDVVLVEGAGGLLVPIWDRYTMADLAADLALPLLVVVGSRLGAVSHTLLTLSHALARGLSVKAYVVNQLSSAVDAAVETNAELLARSTDVPCAGTVGCVSPGGDPIAAAAAAVRRAVQIDDLLAKP